MASDKTKSKVLTGQEFCKAFRIDGHQVVFILLDDVDHIPVLTLICEIDGERVKSEFQPEARGEFIADQQFRYDFALKNLNATTRETARDMYEMLVKRWRETKAGDELTVGVGDSSNKKAH